MFCEVARSLAIETSIKVIGICYTMYCESKLY